MEDVVEAEQAKEAVEAPSPPAETQQATEEVDTSSKRRSLERGSPNSSVKRNGSLRRGKGSLRRDQRTGEKRRSRTGSLGSLVGYEAKYPVSLEYPRLPFSLAELSSKYPSLSL